MGSDLGKYVGTRLCNPGSGSGISSEKGAQWNQGMVRNLLEALSVLSTYTLAKIVILG